MRRLGGASPTATLDELRGAASGPVSVPVVVNNAAPVPLSVPMPDGGPVSVNTMIMDGSPV